MPMEAVVDAPSGTSPDLSWHDARMGCGEPLSDHERNAPADSDGSSSESSSATALWQGYHHVFSVSLVVDAESD